MAKVEQIAGLRTFLVGGTDRSGGGTGPLVCLLHGFGATGEDLAGLWRVLDVPRDTRFAFPEAPISLAGMFGMPAYCWWHIDVQRFVDVARTGIGIDKLFDEEPAGLSEARARIQRWLAELCSKLGVARDQVVLGGFSQGAMLSVDVALNDQRGQRGQEGQEQGAEQKGLAGLALLSGALINRPNWLKLRDGALPVPRFQSHGTVDDVLPFAAGQALHDFLSAGPFPGTLRRFYGRHEIPPDVINDLSAWLQKVLASRPAV